MNSFEQLIGNRVLVSAVVGWFVAQVLKTVIHTIVTKKFEPERLTGSGGMPSSHSSTVCAMAAVSGQIYGLGSFEFAVTVILAIIVMHDAMGVRLETGKQAKLINERKNACGGKAEGIRGPYTAPGADGSASGHYYRPSPGLMPAVHENISHIDGLKDRKFCGKITP